MKNFLKYLFFCVFCSLTFKAQKFELSSDNKELLNSIRLLDSDRLNRVNQFILSHDLSGVLNPFNIYDVIDNKPLFISNDNLLASMAAKNNHLYQGGSLNLNLSGEGYTIGVWDGGWCLSNHVEFLTNGVSRISQPDNFTNSTTSDSHATHVTGTVAASGVNQSARGMAPKVSINSYNWTFDQTEVIAEIGTGMLISNHSYGIPIFSNNQQNAPTWMMGCYNTTAREWDLIANNNPYYLSVHSAGNAGQDSYTGGFHPSLDKLTSAKNAKNILVIGNAAVNVHPITGNMTSFNINPGSSQGPCDDGRIKPDIAARGSSVFSTTNSSTTNYQSQSGTSMSAPVVSGSLILLQELYNNLYSQSMRSSTLRGLVCHTALDDTANVGPDPYFGWGLLDNKAAAEVIINSNNSTAILDERILTMNSTYSFDVLVDNPKTLKATICWNDPAGNSQNNQLNSLTPALVHDLDLRITKDGVTFFPWKLDMTNLDGGAIKGDNTVDNIEVVEVLNASGTYTITVSQKGFMFSPQNYSLIVTGYDQVLSKDDFDLSSSVTVFPNPTNGIFSIKSSVALDSFVLYDIQGRIVAKSEQNILKNDSILINIENHKTGVYFVELVSGKNKVIKKIIKN